MSYINDDIKYKLFINKLTNEKEFTKELHKLFKIKLKDSFKNILNIPKIDFLNKLSNDVNSILDERYSSKIFENEIFEKLILLCSKKFEKKYDNYVENLSSQWQNFFYQKSYIKRNDNEENNLDLFYFKNFTKHCPKTGEYALHLCNKKGKISKFIKVYKKEEENNNKIKFVICENCRKAYFIEIFNNYCESCNIKYYCTITNTEKKEDSLENEDKSLFLATIFPPHCNILFNKIILCPKCSKNLYINIKTNKLICLNQKCDYINDNPDKLELKCNKCNSNYITRAIIYNKSEVIYFENLIKRALILKKLAQPQKTCCINNEKISSVQFFHNKRCHGILYLFRKNKTLFIVCEKCRAINYFRYFIWTCPFCGLYYREMHSEENEEKLITKYIKRDINKRNTSRNRSNLNEYIKKKNIVRSIDSKDESLFKSQMNINENYKIYYLKKNLSKNLINTIEKFNYKLKNISTDFSTSFLDTNNELNLKRWESRNKKSGLCRKILNGFIKLDERAWNSVDKRKVIKAYDSLPNYNIDKISNQKPRIKCKINLMPNIGNFTSSINENEDKGKEENEFNILNNENDNLISEAIEQKNDKSDKKQYRIKSDLISNYDEIKKSNNHILIIDSKEKEQ